jgi:hypothetical protein
MTQFVKNSLRTHPQNAEVWASEMVDQLDKILAGEELVKIS